MLTFYVEVCCKVSKRQCDFLFKQEAPLKMYNNPHTGKKAERRLLSKRSTKNHEAFLCKNSTKGKKKISEEKDNNEVENSELIEF